MEGPGSQASPAPNLRDSLWVAIGLWTRFPGAQHLWCDEAMRRRGAGPQADCGFCRAPQFAYFVGSVGSGPESVHL